MKPRTTSRDERHSFGVWNGIVWTLFTLATAVALLIACAALTIAWPA